MKRIPAPKPKDPTRRRSTTAKPPLDTSRRLDTFRTEDPRSKALRLKQEEKRRKEYRRKYPNTGKGVVDPEETRRARSRKQKSTGI